MNRAGLVEALAAEAVTFPRCESHGSAWTIHAALKERSEPSPTTEYRHAPRAWNLFRLLHCRDDQAYIGAHLRIGARSVAQLVEPHSDQCVILDSDVGGAPADQCGVGWREMAAEPPIGSDTPFVAAVPRAMILSARKVAGSSDLTRES